VEPAKSKVTLYMRPELHKMLKLRSVQQDMKMSELAELLLEHYLLQANAPHVFTCPHCQEEFMAGTNRTPIASKLPVGSA
jgi:hypothetical protein